MAARRFLAPQARAGNGHGYLSQPAREYPTVADSPEVVARIADATDWRDEPEGPSGAWVDAQAELAAKYDRMRLQRQHEDACVFRQALTVENRILDAHRRAKLKHIDLTGEFHILRKMLARGNENAAVERLERVEARLDGVTLEDAA